MTHSYVWRDSFISVTWLIHKCNVTHFKCDVTHSYVWRDSFIRVTWLIHMCDVTHLLLILCVTWLIIINATWLIHKCDVTHSCGTWLIHVGRDSFIYRNYVWHDSFICSWGTVCGDAFISVTWLIHVCDVTLSLVWRDTFMSVTGRMTRLLHVCDMTHSCVWHDSFICVLWLIHMRSMTHAYVWRDPCICVTWPMHMCGMTHSYAWYESSIFILDAPSQEADSNRDVTPGKTHSYVWHVT